MKKLAQLVAFAALITACNSKAPETKKTVLNTDTIPQATHPGWVKNANIYEVNIRQYTPEGTFKAFLKHLPRLKAMGVDILWFMPIQPIGVVNRKGNMGSYYSISNYQEVNPDYGTIEDFNQVVDSAHALGMKVMLDWVANHTSFDHNWVSIRPDFYTKDAAGKSPIVALGNDGKPTDWTDVADLDYTQPDLTGAMTEAMRFWVTNSKIDGFRCDMAGMVPTAFWEYAIPQLKLTNPNLFFLAEWEDPELMRVFNMDYSWSFHHDMKAVAKGEKKPTVFNDYLRKIDSIYNPNAIHMYFTTNHDENAWQGTEFERLGEFHKTMFVLATTFQNGMPLLYSGQEVGNTKRLRFFEKDTINWSNQDLTSFYTKMLKLKHDNKALWNGAEGGKMTLIETGKPDEIYAFYREKDGNRVLVFLNFSNKAVTFTPKLDKLLGEYKTIDANSAVLDWSSAPEIMMLPAEYLVVVKN